VPDLWVQQLLPEQAVLVQRLRLLQELLPKHFVGEPRSSCSEQDFP
jgi:hypothetical protein